MKKNLKLLSILLFFVLLFIPTVKSFGINMNLEPINIQSNTTENNNLDTNTSTDNNTSSSNSHKTITVTSSDNHEFLTVENVLSILLIVIGILLVFLGIAIIIRFK